MDFDYPSKPFLIFRTCCIPGFCIRATKSQWSISSDTHDCPKIVRHVVNRDLSPLSRPYPMAIFVWEAWYSENYRWVLRLTLLLSKWIFILRLNIVNQHHRNIGKDNHPLISQLACHRVHCICSGKSDPRLLIGMRAQFTFSIFSGYTSIWHMYEQWTSEKWNFWESPSRQLRELFGTWWFGTRGLLL